MRRTIAAILIATTALTACGDVKTDPPDRAGPTTTEAETTTTAPTTTVPPATSATTPTTTPEPTEPTFTDGPRSGLACFDLRTASGAAATGDDPSE